MDSSKPFKVQISGHLACFTRPEFKVERVSYDVPTPSALRGVLDSILWKPAIRWQIHDIAVLKPIKKISFRRNEVNSRASTRAAPYYADEDRAQRNTVALKDVKYVVTASFTMTEKAGPRDNVTKFEEMFERRLDIGQYHHKPCLGCREFPADVRPAPSLYQPEYRGVTVPMGMMLLDIDCQHSKGDSAKDQALWFEATMRDGVISVPSVETARSARS